MVISKNYNIPIDSELKSIHSFLLSAEKRLKKVNKKESRVRKLINFIFGKSKKSIEEDAISRQKNYQTILSEVASELEGLKLSDKTEKAQDELLAFSMDVYRLAKSDGDQEKLQKELTTIQDLIRQIFKTEKEEPSPTAEVNAALFLVDADPAQPELVIPGRVDQPIVTNRGVVGDAITSFNKSVVGKMTRQVFDKVVTKPLEKACTQAQYATIIYDCKDGLWNAFLGDLMQNPAEGFGQDFLMNLGTAVRVHAGNAADILDPSRIADIEVEQLKAVATYTHEMFKRYQTLQTNLGQDPSLLSPEQLVTEWRALHDEVLALFSSTGANSVAIEGFKTQLAVEAENMLFIEGLQNQATYLTQMQNLLQGLPLVEGAHNPFTQCAVPSPFAIPSADMCPLGAQEFMEQVTTAVSEMNPLAEEAFKDVLQSEGLQDAICKLTVSMSEGDKTAVLENLQALGAETTNNFESVRLKVEAVKDSAWDVGSWLIHAITHPVEVFSDPETWYAAGRHGVTAAKVLGPRLAIGFVAGRLADKALSPVRERLKDKQLNGYVTSAALMACQFTLSMAFQQAISSGLSATGVM